MIAIIILILVVIIFIFIVIFIIIIIIIITIININTPQFISARAASIRRKKERNPTYLHTYLLRQRSILDVVGPGFRQVLRLVSQVLDQRRGQLGQRQTHEDDHQVVLQLIHARVGGPLATEPRHEGDVEEGGVGIDEFEAETLYDQTVFILW